jgi:hypothetical protein
LFSLLFYLQEEKQRENRRSPIPGDWGVNQGRRMMPQTLAIAASERHFASSFEGPPKVSL